MQVATARADDAERTLGKVLRLRPNSAPGEYLLGRVALARGNGQEALTHFDRALSLDATAPEYHLYAARAALRASDLGRAHDEVQLALRRDKRYADAYLVRAQIRLRAGAVRDALRDAALALKYNPSGQEAYVTMGDCYEQLRKLKEAIGSYEKALAQRPEQAYWWYRLGRLRLDNGAQADAAKALARATAQAQKQTEAPPWLADAHRIYAEATYKKQRSTAIKHFRRYLRLAPPSAIDRRDVIRRLRRWGVKLADQEVALH